MTKLSFFSVLKSNLKCAFCKKKNCLVKYFPERKKVQYYNGSKFVTECEKDKEARENAIFKKHFH